MKTEQTRALIETYYAALEALDRDAIAPLLAEDVVLRMAETVPSDPVVGRRPVSGAVSQKGLATICDISTFVMTVHHTTVDGDTAVVQQRHSVKTLEGKQYENEYCWVYTCRDGVIVDMLEYADTWKAAQVFGW